MLHFFAKRLREMQEVRRDERGFTLIELLVVVIIIGILAAIAIPVFLAQRERAWNAAAESNLRNAAAAATSCVADTGDADGSCSTEVMLQDYGYSLDTNVDLTITAPDDDSWSATAQHVDGGTTYEFSLATGQVQPQAAPGP